MTFLSFITKPLYWLNRQVDGKQKGTVNTNKQIGQAEQYLQGLWELNREKLVAETLPALAVRLAALAAAYPSMGVVNKTLIKQEAKCEIAKIRDLGEVLPKTLQSVVDGAYLPDGAMMSDTTIHYAVNGVIKALKEFNVVPPPLALPPPEQAEIFEPRKAQAAQTTPIALAANGSTPPV